MKQRLLSNQNTEVSEEAFTDAIYDLFTGGYTQSDLQEARRLSGYLKEVEKAPIDIGQKVSIINDKKTVIEFYVKKGRLIRSFESELKAQIKHLQTYRECLIQVKKIISQVPSDIDDLTLLEDVNDANMMPLYKKIQEISLLGSYSFYVENNKHFEDYGQRYSTAKDNKKMATHKRIPILSFLNGWIFGGLVKWTATSGYIALTKLIFKTKLFIELAALANLGFLTYYLYQSYKDGVQNYKDSKNWNKRYEELLNDIFEASAIEGNTFINLTNQLDKATNDLMLTIFDFDVFVKNYHTENKIVARVLSNFKQTTGVIIRALKAQGRYYRDIQKEAIKPRNIRLS